MPSANMSGRRRASRAVRSTFPGCSTAQDPPTRRRFSGCCLPRRDFCTADAGNPATAELKVCGDTMDDTGDDTGDDTVTDDRQWFADHFAEQRPRLRAVAYRMLGSMSEAEDALQEAWIRSIRSDSTS